MKMKRVYLYIIMCLAAMVALPSCYVADDSIEVGVEVGGGGAAPSSAIAPSCVVESHGVSRAEKYGLAVRSLVDQITTKQLDANFLRLDEDLDGSNNGLYTFNANDLSSTYAVNWNKANLLEATVISSPDNTTGIHYRSVSLAPEQSYKLNIKESTIDGVKVRDTTHFYHTRMVGWYPQNCVLPRKEGVPATAQFDYSAFDAVRLNETVEIDGVPTEVVALQFTGLDGETDLMVSNVCEGQSWHKYNSTMPHQSDVHPQDGTNIYRSPFGHNFESPTYSNYFTYRHYRSAVRITAYADQSAQNLIMWGEIQDVVIRNQPTSCKIWLPTRLGEFGKVYHWGDYKNLPITCTPMFDNDSNHPEFNQTVTYPIRMEGSSSKEDIYLGYSLIEPNRDLELEIHTSSGVYSTVIEAAHKVKDENGNETTVDIFQEGYIYDVKLNLKTDGSIAAILLKEGDELFYDLSSLHQLDVDEDVNNEEIISTFKLANCYILDPSKYRDENGNDIYDGYSFLASVVGNGDSGIISSGAQTLYPTTANISPVSAHLLWESSLGLISDVELKYGYVRFKLPDPTAQGNAVIAVYDKNDKILWSWHIWITDTPAEQSFSTGDHMIILLDRNIGATAATCTGASDALETYGLYYQWGRKDPSMGPPSYNYAPINLNTAPYYDFTSDEKSAAEVTQFAQPTLKDGVENPMYLVMPTAQPQSYIFNWLYLRYDFLWGYDISTGMTNKTIYDPCPYGYRVPSSELHALFSEGSGSAGTYGYTRTVDGTAFFLPYAGFKGVDVGLNSLVCSWKYVGQKGDYQTSTYCTNADAENMGGVSQYMHRSRIYVSKSNYWSETNVGTYSGNLHLDYANRRTAAPVRCVKDEMIGSINASITPSIRVLMPGTQITLTYDASSYGSAIEYFVLRATYTNTSGVEITKTLREEEGIHKFSIDGSVLYTLPTDANELGVKFTLNVRNEHGLADSEQIALVENAVDIAFNRWEDTILPDEVNSSTRNFVVIGQDVNYYVNISSDREPTSVTINDVTATKRGEFAGGSVSNTTWSIPWSQNTKGIYDFSVEAVIDGGTVSASMPTVTVYGLIRHSNTNTIDTSGNTMYALSNSNYTSTYLTAEDTTLEANATLNYYSLFTVEDEKIRSEARWAYMRGTNGSVSFNATGTNYDIEENGNYTRITYSTGGWFGRTYYLRQSNTTAVAFSTSSDRVNWSFYPITYDIP